MTLPASGRPPVKWDSGVVVGHCVPSSRRCNLPRSPRNKIAPRSRLMWPVLITFILSFLSLGRGAESFHRVLPSGPSRRYPQHGYLFGVFPQIPRSPQTARVRTGGDRRGARAGAHPAPAPVPAARTASDAPRHKGTLPAHSVQLTDKTTTTTRGTYG